MFTHYPKDIMRPTITHNDKSFIPGWYCLMELTSVKLRLQLYYHLNSACHCEILYMFTTVFLLGDGTHICYIL